MRILVIVFLIIFGNLNTKAEVGSDCGGIAGLQCGNGEFCKFEPGQSCGAGDQMGICAQVPEVCTLEFLPVCACDGLIYGNACEATAAGQSLAQAAHCTKAEPSLKSSRICIQAIACGTKDGMVKEYPNPCAAADDGATDISLKTGDSCSATQ